VPDSPAIELAVSAATKFRKTGLLPVRLTPPLT
jgi:hypothetical protein